MAPVLMTYIKTSNKDKLILMVDIWIYKLLGSEWKDVSEEAKSFILKMLTVDPTKRISAEMGLKDPWIISNEKINKINPKNL